MYRIERHVETDTGHRVPNHASKCRHLHGHRYRWTAVLEGDVVEVEGVSDEGMLMDFGDVKTLLMTHIHDIVDHACIVHEQDETTRAALEAMGPDHRTVIVPFVPTAENLAKWAFEQVAPHISTRYDNALRLVALRVHETPNCVAEWRE